MLKTKGERTRQAILDVAAKLATEELQLATVDHAASLFVAEVIEPARAAPRGLARVWALCDHMLDYAERQVFPGGCFFAATSFEFNNRSGPVRDRIQEMLGAWLSYLEHAVEQAQEAGELDSQLTAREIAFQLDAFAQAANAQYQLFRNDRVFDDARRAVSERLDTLRPAVTA